jgi:hypothetical protein
LCTRRLAGAPLLDFAIVLVAAAGRSGVGKNAIDACLDRLDPVSREITGSRMANPARLSSESSDDVKAGLHHLVAAADARYPDAESFAAMTDDVPHASEAQQGVLPLIREALLEVVAFCRDPGNPRRNERVEKSLSAVYAIKDATIFGRPLS